MLRKALEASIDMYEVRVDADTLIAKWRLAVAEMDEAEGAENAENMEGNLKMVDIQVENPLRG